MDGLGCVGGFRNTLTHNERLKILEAVFEEARLDMAFYTEPASPGELAVYEPTDGGTAVRCTVLEWESNGPGWCKVIYEGAVGVGLVQQEVPTAAIIRFAPHYTDTEINAIAVECGCDYFDPPAKQLRFEMRSLRKDLGLALSMQPGEYLRRKEQGTQQEAKEQEEGA